MNKDVFISILAMDSYNRGPTPGLVNLPLLGNIGTAQIRDEPLPPNASAALNIVQAKDVWSGWTLGARFAVSNDNGDLREQAA